MNLTMPAINPATSNLDDHMNTAIAKPPLINSRYLLIGLFMLVTAGLALALTPRIKAADQGPKIDLETMIPKRFGDWRVDDGIVPIQVSPDVQASLNKIYNQTLARTYINSNGNRIMLSIAYGGDQRDTIKLHRPEGCYAGQGFAVHKQEKSVLTVAKGSMPVIHLVTQQNSRNEIVTYWIVIGERLALSDFEIKVIKINYAMSGEIPDGMLVRISSLSSDEQAAYKLHQEYAGSLYWAVSPGNRSRVFGES